MKYRAWLYCRVEDGRSADTQTILNSQKTQLELFCAEQDLAIAGTSRVTGNGVNELRELVRNGIEQDSFDMIAAVSVSRFGHDPQEIIEVADELALHGKGICMVKEGVANVPGFSLGDNSQHESDSIEMGGQSL